jgi:hypothetical protein
MTNWLILGLAVILILIGIPTINTPIALILGIGLLIYALYRFRSTKAL